MVMHVGSLRARLHDTGGQSDFRSGESSPRLMPHWIENFIPVRKVANKYQNNHSIRQEIGIVDKCMRDSRQSKMASTVYMQNPSFRLVTCSYETSQIKPSGFGDKNCRRH